MVAPGLVDRYVNVYFPSKDDKKRWEAAAEEKGLTLSKFIFGTIESVLSAEKETPRYELVQELSDLKGEVQKLSSELKMKNLLLEKLEAEIYKTRYASFGEADRKESEGMMKSLLCSSSKEKPLTEMLFSGN